MSFPGYPRPESGRPGGWPADQPGPIPLRPLGVGDLLGVAVTVVRRCAVPLCLAAFLAALLSNGTTLAVLALAGSLRTYAEATWLQDIIDGGSSIPPAIIVSALSGLVVSTVGGVLVAGMAAAGAGSLAQGRDGRGAVAQRMAGRWGALLGVAVVVGVLCSLGLMLLVVPGVIAYLILVLAAPAAVMERAGIGESMRRSAQLSRGHRGRILGVTLLAGIISGFTSTVITTVLSSVVSQSDPVSALLITQLIGTVVAAFTGAWTGAVIALIYIDIRIRTEHLDYALRIAAESDRRARLQDRAPGPDQRPGQRPDQPPDGLIPPPPPAG
ncbi:hypothetical protein [Nakamurella multipartita]|uniref:hypothetical protein n=1 Tax=Nakamurella multipartita TaxID=53461 RepID=UPI0010FEDB6B|nr:hypothetical protein [Nakamurella multipartita]